MAGLGTGYLNAKEKEKDRERQAKKDAQDGEAHDARMYEANKSRRKDEVIAEAHKPTTVNENAVTLDVSGKPALYDISHAADVAGSDYRQMQWLTQTQNPGIEPTDAQLAAGAPQALVATHDHACSKGLFGILPPSTAGVA